MILINGELSTGMRSFNKHEKRRNKSSDWFNKNDWQTDTNEDWQHAYRDSMKNAEKTARLGTPNDTRQSYATLHRLYLGTYRSAATFIGQWRIYPPSNHDRSLISSHLRITGHMPIDVAVSNGLRLLKRFPAGGSPTPTCNDQRPCTCDRCLPTKHRATSSAAVRPFPPQFGHFLRIVLGPSMSLEIHR